jgi:Lectin C-type domain
MKTSIAVYSAAIMLFAAAFDAKPDVITGPITNPSNGHVYYLLSPNTWVLSEAEAETIGGTLAIIKSADEQKWVFVNFSLSADGGRAGLWIGLHRINLGGPFVWITGAKLEYTNWNQGEPNDVGGIENCVHMTCEDSTAPGKWNDLPDHDFSTRLFGVVELSGKAEEKTLSKEERALIGTWYEGGKLERPCWVAGTDNDLFMIQANHFAARAAICADGFILQSQLPMAERIFNGFNSEMNLRGEIIKDRILWSNGTWWSRKPSKYTINENKTHDDIKLSP